jgi:hypothetical protein
MTGSRLKQAIDTKSEFFERELKLLSKDLPDDPRVIRDRIIAHRKELGIEFLEKRDFKLEYKKKSNSLVVRLRQTHNGIPMANCEIVAEWREGGLSHLRINVRKPNLKKYPSRAGQVDPEKAEEIVLNTLASTQGEWKVHDNRKIFVQIGGLDVMVYSIRAHSVNPLGSWMLIIEANGGHILRKINLLRFIDARAALISPNPVAVSRRIDLRPIGGCENMYAETRCVPPPDFSSPADFDLLKSSVTLKDVQVSGQNIVLKGPIIEVLKGGTSPSPSSYPSNMILDFPIFDSRGGIDYECLMVYYHIDSFQRYFQSELGFSYLLNHPIVALVESSSEDYYMACYDTMTKRIHFFRKNFQCWEDAAEDGDVIIHEYIHAIFDDLTIDDAQLEDEFHALEEGVATFVPCIFFAPSCPFNYSVWADWMYSDCLPFPKDLKVRTELYTDWPSMKPVPPLPGSDEDAWAIYEANIRAWWYEGGLILASFLIISYDAACNGTPKQSTTNAFLLSLFDAIDLLGGADSMEDCSELFMTNIIHFDMELEPIRRMLKVINEKKLMEFKLSYLGINKPTIGDWRDPILILDEAEGVPPSLARYQLTNGSVYDIWLESTQKELIVGIRLTNRQLMGPIPYRGGDARLFVVQIDFDANIAGNPTRIDLPKHPRILSSNLPLGDKRSIRFKLPLEVLRDIGSNEFRVVVSLVTPYGVHEINSDWHESPMQVLTKLYDI